MRVVDHRIGGRAMWEIVCALMVMAFGVPAQALADPPPNDARGAAESISPPATVTGTTSESTVEADEPSACEALRGSLLYEFRAPTSDRMIVRLRATGDLDATVDVFLRTRSQLGR